MERDGEVVERVSESGKQKRGNEKHKKGDTKERKTKKGRSRQSGTLGLSDRACSSSAHLRPSQSFHCSGPCPCPAPAPGADMRRPCSDSTEPVCVPPEARAEDSPEEEAEWPVEPSRAAEMKAEAEEALGWAHGSGGGAGRDFLVSRRCTRYA